MEKYKFNLQLFNDGTTDEDPVIDNEVRTEPTKVGLDENNNVRFIYDEPEPSNKGEEEKPDNTPADSTPEEQAEQQDFYSPDEVRTTDFDKLDPSKIPAEMLPWYKSMQAGFTRKTQEIAEKSKELDSILEKARQIPQSQTEQKSQLTPEQYFTQRHNFLAGQVAEMFGGQIDDDMQFWTPAQRLAYEQLNNQLSIKERSQIEEQQQQQRKQQENKSFLDSLETELRSADPEAYDYTLNRIKTGEVLEKDKQAIQTALQKGDKDTVKKYFENYRKEYHAEKQGIKGKAAPTPPQVEKPGGSGKPEPKGAPDYNELANLKSFDDKIKWMRQHGIRP